MFYELNRTCDPTQANRRPEFDNLSISVGNLLLSLGNRFLDSGGVHVGKKIPNGTTQCKLI